MTRLQCLSELGMVWYLLEQFESADVLWVEYHGLNNLLCYLFMNLPAGSIIRN